MNGNKIKYLTIILTIVTITPLFSQITSAAPPPAPETYDTTIESDCSVYINEENPSLNYNTGTNKYYLDIQQDEFTYQRVSYVKFDLSSLPDDAEVLDAEIHLYSIAAPDAPSTVKMYRVIGTWIESSVTWNTRASYKDFTKTQGLIDSLVISSAGWHEWDATSIVEDWLDGSKANNGVAFETNENLPRFRSDESAYKPRLYILYQTSSGEEPEDPPEDPVEDTTPCEITYTVTPENPENGDEVTISATATDDIGLEYLTIKEGSIELCSSFAEDDETTTLMCNYTETLFTPGKTFFIEANDLGSSSTQLITLTISVEGTGTNPEVSLYIEFDTDSTSPDKYRLLPMDGQRVDITATASDPDGIDFMTITYDGMPIDFSYDPPETEVEETISLINGVDILDDCTVPCTFRYSVRAYDVEGRSTRVEGDDIELAAPWQWYWGLPFENWGCDENHTWSWSMMESIFGDEVWWNEEYGWRKPHADYLFQNKIKEGGRKGQCYGMCALSLELASTSSSIYANMIQPTAVSIDDLEQQNWNNTWPYYFARQSGQYSQDCCFLQAAQWLLQPEWSGSRPHPYIDDILDEIIDDLNAGTPGILGIHEGSHGHAVVPWRVVPLGGDRYNVYIYDPNREYSSTHDSLDYTNFDHYPFIVFGQDGWARNGWWSYQWNSSSTWNENIYYTPYNTAIGNAGSYNYIGVTPTTVRITDQPLPDPVQTLIHGSGDVSFYAEDSSRRKTGYVNGTLLSEIPYSAPLLESMGANGKVDSFMLPNNITLTIYAESSVDTDREMGDYSLMLWDNSSFYALENVSCSKDTVDKVTCSLLESQASSSERSVRFRRGDVTELRASDPMDYTIRFAKEFYNSPKLVGREYIVSSSEHENGAEIELYVSEDYDDLIVETFDTPFSFSVTTRSTESLEDDPDIDYIPETTEEFTMKANEKLVVTPENWATTSVSGSFSSSDSQSSDGDSDKNETKDGSPLDGLPDIPGFEIVLFVTAIFIGLLYTHRLGKKRKKE